jgi:hypothetical protein
MMTPFKAQTTNTTPVWVAGLSRVQGVEAGLSTLNRLVHPTSTERFPSDDSSI